MNQRQIQQMMKQAQKLQKDMETSQSELDSKTYSSSAAGGALKIDIKGNKRISNISIDQELMDDKEILEELLISTINGVIGEIEQESEKKMSAYTQGMPF